MKKFLLGFAFIASLAFMLTSCPGAKAKDKINGSITIYADTSYTDDDNLTVEVELVGENKFKAIQAGNTEAIVVASTVADKNLKGSFKVKDAVANNAQKAVLIYNVTADETTGEGELVDLDGKNLKVTISKNFLSGSPAEDLEVGTFKINVNKGVTLEVVSSGEITDEIVGFSLSSGSISDPVDVRVNLKGYTFNDAVAPAEEGADPTAANWFGDKLSGVVKSVAENKKSAVITMSYKKGGTETLAVSTSAVDINLDIPTAAVTGGVKQSNVNKYFIYDSTNASATLTGNVVAVKGAAITEQTVTINLVGTCNRVSFKANQDFTVALIGASQILASNPMNLFSFSENNNIDAVFKKDVPAGSTSCEILFKPKKDGDNSKTVDEVGQKSALCAMIPNDYVFGDVMAKGSSENGLFTSVFDVTDATLSKLSGTDGDMLAIQGTVDTAITKSSIVLTLPEGYKFKEKAEGTAVSEWVELVGGTELAAGLSVTVSTEANANTAKFDIQGTPTNACTGFIKITVPADKLAKEGVETLTDPVVSTQNAMIMIVIKPAT